MKRINEWFVVVSKFPSMCWGCGKTIAKNDIVWFNPELQQAKHMSCRNKVLYEDL